jgi:hypothetical protein
MARGGGSAKVSNSDNDSAHFCVENGWGSTATLIREIALRKSNGTGITAANDSTNGASVTINRPGLFLITYSDNPQANTDYHGISKNASSLTTGILSLASSERLAYAENRLGSGVQSYRPIVWMGKLESGDVVRPHTDSTNFQTGGKEISFSVTRIGL